MVKQETRPTKRRRGVGRHVPPLPRAPEREQVEPKAPVRPRRLTLLLVIALAAVVAAIAIGVWAVMQLATDVGIVEPEPVVPAEPGAWMELDPWIERQMRLQEMRAGVAGVVQPDAWMELDPWIERQMRLHQLRSAGE
jgi:hypothetical protein